jgi:hypothetical protein
MPAPGRPPAEGRRRCTLLTLLKIIKYKLHVTKKETKKIKKDYT